MMTWKLWRELKYPPRANRLFQLTITTHTIAHTPFPSLVLLIILVILPLSAFTSRTMASVLSFLVLVSIPILAILQIFTGSFFGLMWAVRTASSIAQIRRRGIYETLCLLPDGALGVNWVICAACLYWDGKYREFDSHYTWPIRLFIIFGLAVYLSPALLEDQIWTLVALLINMVTLAFWFRLEDVQSIVLACITGMMIPTYTRHKIEVQIWTATIYIFIQVSSYALVALLAMTILPAIYQISALREWFVSVSRPLLSLAALYLIREYVIYNLWHWLLLRLETHSQENISASCIINRPA